MPPNSPVGQAMAKMRRMEAAAGHRLGAQAIGLAQHDGAERHAEVGAGRRTARRAVAHQRRLLDLGPDHHAGRVAQEQDRQVEGVAELQEARGLVGSRRSRWRRRDASGCWRRCRAACPRCGRAPSPCRAEGAAQLEHRALVGTACRSRRARRRRAAGSRGWRGAAARWSAARHSRQRALEVGEVLLGDRAPPRPRPRRRCRPCRWAPARSSGPLPRARTRRDCRPRSSPARPCRSTSSRWRSPRRSSRAARRCRRSSGPS